MMIPTRRTAGLSIRMDPKTAIMTDRILVLDERYLMKIMLMLRRQRDPLPQAS
jgi:hypothetical protein